MRDGLWVADEDDGRRKAVQSEHMQQEEFSQLFSGSGVEALDQVQHLCQPTYNHKDLIVFFG